MPATQAGIFAPLIARLKAAGAQAAAVTSMGGHFCVGELIPISPLPILNGIPEVDAAVTRGRFKTIGIIGTRMVMETRLYGAISSATVVVPLGAELDEVHESYAAMATAGRVSDAQRRVFFAAGERLCREQGAEVVLLGGTDLFLAFHGVVRRTSCRPQRRLVDCLHVHIGAIEHGEAGIAPPVVRSIEAGGHVALEDFNPDADWRSLDSGHRQPLGQCWRCHSDMCPLCIAATMPMGRDRQAAMATPVVLLATAPAR